MRKIIEEMSKANGPIFTKLYQAAQQEQAAKNGNNGGGEGDPDGGDTIIDND